MHVDYSDRQDYITTPSLVLGPLESYIALSSWANECIAQLTPADARRLRFADPALANLPSPPESHERYRRALIDAVVIFGKLDAIAGKYLFRTHLNRQGVFATWSEMFDELLVTKTTPFANNINNGTTGYRTIGLPIDVGSKEALVASLMNTWSGVGFELNSKAQELVGEFVERRIASPEVIENSDVQKVYHSMLSGIERSIESGIPLLSEHLAGPMWVRDGLADRSCQILELVWDEVAWLPAPSSFTEALNMSNDENIVSLRDSIALWQDQLVSGVFTSLEDIRNQIRKSVANFRGKSWASQVSRFVTYTSVPVGIGEYLLSSTPVGISLTMIGAVSQCVGDFIDRSNSKHWMSIQPNYIHRR